jgi:hypothetical protein
MGSYLSIHRLTLVGLLILGLSASACTGPNPHVKVIGVGQARAPSVAERSQVLLVFVEVVNPTRRDLRISRLEYTLSADSWFETSGKVSLARDVGAGSSAVVEIAVPLERVRDMPRGAAYNLEGKLFAREERYERSWKVAVKGALADQGTGTAMGRARVRIADLED